MSYLDELEGVAASDVTGLREAELSYGDSWKKRGGVGAFMMLARKWDRIEKAMAPTTVPVEIVKELLVPPWDIFARTEADGREEGLMDDIRDLRRYLMLVEAELIARKTGGASA